MKLQLLTETTDPTPYIRGDAWCAQEKLNGERLCLVKKGSVVTGYNRRGRERPIPATTLAVALLSDHDWTIDGELVGDASSDVTNFRAMPCHYADAATCRKPQHPRGCRRIQAGYTCRFFRAP